MNVIFRASQSWSPLPSMPIARSRCHAGFVTYPNGDKGILVAGGVEGEGTDGLTSTDFLNLETLIWVPKQSLPFDIRYGASVPFQDSFLIVGGFSIGELEGYLQTVYYYDPNLDQWILIERMDFARERFTAFMVPDSFANCI